MPDSLAIQLRNVSKIYRLHGSQFDQLVDVLRLQRFGFKPKSAPKEFPALDDISLDVPKGSRIGIVGRNGAGKTTLLKLICGNFMPTYGDLHVQGKVQALMSVGLGFHPDYTGRQNIEASLQYNGLAKMDRESAFHGIIEFCELGDFIDQPFKTYSLGMQARLMFAAATAIQPDILIVDEVLSAGDAYFVAKSKRRVEDLVSSGCTMLLVSHSMQQILELCDKAIWIEKGKIRMQGEAFEVVKAYEEHLHGVTGLIKQTKKLAQAPIRNNQKNLGFAAKNSSISESGLKSKAISSSSVSGNLLQEPAFQPHSQSVNLNGPADIQSFKFLARGGLSRWAGDPSIKITGFSVITDRGESNTLMSMKPAKIVMTLECEVAGTYNCRYGVAIHNVDGICVSRVFSPCDGFSLEAGHYRVVELIFNPLQLGPGEYTIGISITEYTDLEGINNSRRFDLLSRSFQINVELPESLQGISAQFFHSAEWNFITSDE